MKIQAVLNSGSSGNSGSLANWILVTEQPPLDVELSFTQTCRQLCESLGISFISVVLKPQHEKDYASNTTAATSENNSSKTNTPGLLNSVAKPELVNTNIDITGGILEVNVASSTQAAAAYAVRRSLGM